MSDVQEVKRIILAALNKKGEDGALSGDQIAEHPTLGGYEPATINGAVDELESEGVVVVDTFSDTGPEPRYAFDVLYLA